MNLVRFRSAGTARWGLLRGDRVFDVTPLTGAAPEAIHDWLDPARLAILETDAADAGIPTEDVDFAPFLPGPEKIICVGVNYPDRNAEYRDGSTAPAYPSLFLRTPSSFTGHGHPLVRPAESAMLDYEGEIVLVIGRAGRRDSWYRSALDAPFFHGNPL